MSKHRNEGPPDYPPGSEEEHMLIAQYALGIIKWRWFPGCEVVRKRDEQMLIPALLFGLYLARKRNKKISKGEACDLMGVDRATTGPKFIKALADDALIEIHSDPKIDKRKDFLTATVKLERLVEAELVRLARSLKRVADDLEFVERWSGVDAAEASRVPSGDPTLSSLLPVDWPSDAVGAPTQGREPLRRR